MLANRIFTLLITPLGALALLAGCATPQPADDSAPAAPMDALVSTEWLAANLDDPDLVVLDATVLAGPTDDGGFRIDSGREDYEAGHIPGAGFADLLVELSDTDSPHMFALPEPEAFAATMASYGVGDDSRVVIYDATNTAWAARVWWMLRWVGFDNAALLDGGLAAWRAEGRPLETGAVEREPAELSVALRPGLIADRDTVLAAVEHGSTCLYDALSEASYSGEVAMYSRPGHIPGAHNVPSNSLLDETGRFRPRAELADLFTCQSERPAITYCGGGIAASADAFAMHLLGYEDVAVYIASLQEWAADPANPMVTGTSPEGE